MALIKVINPPYIIGIGENPSVTDGISQEEYDLLTEIFLNKPKNPDGYRYMLRADTLEWELVEIPPEPEDNPIEPEEPEVDAEDVVVTHGQEQTE